jgi:hypothetical protein
LAGGLARAELEHGAGVATRPDAPWRDGLRDVEHTEVLVEEHDVDREAHEGRVHRACGAKQQPLVWFEPATAQQAPQAGPVGVGDYYVHAV